MLALGAGWAALLLSASAQPAPMEGPAITLADTLRRVLGEGAEVGIARQELRQLTAFVGVEYGAFSPVLKLSGLFRAEANPGISAGFSYYYPLDTFHTTTFTASADVGGRLLFGTDYDLKVGWIQTASDAYATVLTPLSRAAIEATISQPLLQNLGGANQLGIQSARIRQRLGSAQLEKIARDQGRLAAESYVNLQTAQARIEARQKSRDLARSLQGVTRELIQAGRLVPSAELPTEVVVSQREQELADAKIELAHVRTALALVTDTPEWINAHASEALDPRSVIIAEADVGELAESNSPDVQSKARELDLASVDVRIRKNAALPDLRVVGGAGLFGEAGTSQCSNGYFVDGVTPCSIPPEFNGGPGTAIQNLGAFRYGFLQGGLQFSMPLNRGPLRDAMRAADLGYRNAERQLEHLKLETRLRAEDSARTALADGAELVEVRKAVKIAAEGVNWAREGYERGRTTVFELLRAEELLAQTRDREVADAQRLALDNVGLLAETGKLFTALLGRDPFDYSGDEPQQ